MKRVCFAYIAQLDLPGRPVKIGCTTYARRRLASFDHGTPVAVRLIGVTIDGTAREMEMLEATRSTAIKGEWRYPNDALRELVNRYHAAGEWYVPAANHAEHFKATNVRERVSKIRDGYHISPGAVGFHWAKYVLNAAAQSDPLLGLDWGGYVPADTAPSFDWPRALQVAA